MTDRHERSLWEKRWSDGQTRFHESAPNPLLLAHASVLKGRVLVPLAGKSFDVRWLAEQGHEVLGVEFVASAVTGFFDEWKQTPTETSIGGMRVLSASGVTFVIGDMLDVTPEAFARVDSIYDRAALVALEPVLRETYVARCRSLLRDGGVTLLVALGYDQTKTSGPPFSVDEPSARALFAPATVELLARAGAETTPRMRAAGVEAFEESVYRII